MATAKKIKVLNKTVGWNVLFSHTEAHNIGAGHVAVAATLAGVVPPKVTAIIAAVGATWIALCNAGGHDGVKAIVSLIPPPGAVVFLPR